MDKLYATGTYDYRGVPVQFSVDNEFPYPDWQFWGSEGRCAAVVVYQDHDDDDVYDPLGWFLALDGDQQPGQWSWELCHAKALAYVAFGTLPDDTPPGWHEAQEARHAAMMERAKKQAADLRKRGVLR